LELKEYERVKFAQKLRPLLIKSKCEGCGKTENLELHHMKLFNEIIKESLNDLQLQYKNTMKYTQLELDLITNVVLGKHLNIEYLTLCEKCHILIHKENWTNICYNNKHKQYYEKLNLIKEIKRKQYTLELILYLNDILNTKLFTTDKNILINKINIKDNRGRLQKSLNQINEYLNDNSLNYIVISKKDNRKKINNENNSTRGQYYWIVKHKC
jgi:hypothetical protein